MRWRKPPPEPAVTRVAYGTDPDQFAEWRAPVLGAPAPVATAVLLHGGFYRSAYTLDLMRPLAADLVARGWAVFNTEYRRPDAHGWPATLSDLDAALGALRGLPQFDAGVPLVVFGHSAGGQLALELAEAEGDALPEGAAPVGAPAFAPPFVPPIALAVSLAGVVDLGYAVEHRLSSDAVVMALGGTPDEVPGRYAAADPARFERRRAPWLLVQGTGDSADFIAMNRRVSARPELGHPELLEAPGDHFAIIDPASPLWRATVARVEALLA